jgi:hypothetical protein
MPEEQVTNGGFETGDFTGWASAYDGEFYDILITDSHAKTGTYSCELTSMNFVGTQWCQISQDVDFTNVTSFTFSYFISDGAADGVFTVTIDGDTVLSTSSYLGVWVDADIDVSGYTGSKTVVFRSTCNGA